MNRLMLVPLAALALTACQKQSTTESAKQSGDVSLTNASPEEVAKQASAAGGSGIAFTPGKWESKVEVLDMTLPGMEGMPPGFADKIKASMMQPHVTSSCMSPREAHQPSSGMFTGHQQTNCTFSHYTMAGGKIDATMVCHEKTGDMTMHMTGTFAPDNFTVDQEMTAAGPKGGMHSKARVTGRRIGDCTGEDVAK